MSGWTIWSYLAIVLSDMEVRFFVWSLSQTWRLSSIFPINSTNEQMKLGPLAFNREHIFAVRRAGSCTRWWRPHDDLYRQGHPLHFVFLTGQLTIYGKCFNTWYTTSRFINAMRPSRLAKNCGWHWAPNKMHPQQQNCTDVDDNGGRKSAWLQWVCIVVLRLKFNNICVWTGLRQQQQQQHQLSCGVVGWSVYLLIDSEIWWSSVFVHFCCCLKSTATIFRKWLLV